LGAAAEMANCVALTITAY